MPRESLGELPKQQDLTPEDRGEFPTETFVGKRIFADEIMVAPLVVENFSGNVNERDTVKPAGHRSIRIDETVPIRTDQGTGSFIIIRHEEFPVILRTVIEEIRLRKLRPELAQTVETISAAVENQRTGTFVEPVEAGLQIGRVEKRDVKESTAAFGTPLATANRFARTAETVLKPAVHFGK